MASGCAWSWLNGSRPRSRRRETTSLAMISMDSRTPSRRSWLTPTVCLIDSSRASDHHTWPSASGAREAASKQVRARSTSPPFFRSARSATVCTSTARYRPSGHRPFSATTSQRPAMMSAKLGPSLGANRVLTSRLVECTSSLSGASSDGRHGVGRVRASLTMSWSGVSTGRAVTTASADCSMPAVENHRTGPSRRMRNSPVEYPSTRSNSSWACSAASALAASSRSSEYNAASIVASLLARSVNLVRVVGTSSPSHCLRRSSTSFWKDSLRASVVKKCSLIQSSTTIRASLLGMVTLLMSGRVVFRHDDEQGPRQPLLRLHIGDELLLLLNGGSPDAQGMVRDEGLRVLLPCDGLVVPCGDPILCTLLGSVERGLEFLVRGVHGELHQGLKIIRPCDGPWIGHISADADVREHIGRRRMHGDPRGG